MPEDREISALPSELLTPLVGVAMQEDIPSPNTTLSYKDTFTEFSKGVYEANVYQEHPFVEDTEDDFEDTGVMW